MGKTIHDRYEIIEKIGEGGMGAVYLAQDLRLKRKVAVKRLLFQGKPAHEEMFRKRFEREALAMAGFQHPNIVSVHDYGQDDEGVYLVIEYMPGGVLSQQMRKRRFTVEESIKILLPLADALQEIHGMGQVHRDIKPSNILFDKYNNPKLADFGVVKLLESESGHTLTAAGAAVGTPAYMAPELIGGDASPATDQYALGVVLYELVTGKKPFKGRTPMETLYLQKANPLPDPRSFNPELSDWICDVLRKMLAKNPADRYSSVAAVITILRNRGTEIGESENTTLIESIPFIEVSEENETVLSDTKGIDQKEETQAGHEDIVLRPKPNQPDIKEKKSFPKRIVYAGVLVILVGAVIALGSNLMDLDTEGIGFLAGFATATNTATPTSTPVPTTTLTPTASPTPTLGVGSTMIREKDGMEMVYVPEGTFTMGSNRSEDEMSVHIVYLNSYWIDKLEVTNAQYEQCVNANVCTMPDQIVTWSRSNYYGNEEYADFPVVYVNWSQAESYCTWAGGNLPTEAQWEKAARGTDGRTYPWGEMEPNCNLANYSFCSSDTDVVGNYPDGASPYGALDIAGNVREWVADWYDSDYYDNSPSDNPTGPTSGEYRALRGGAWNLDENQIRTADRNWEDSLKVTNYGGFRCVYPAGDQ